MSSPPQPKTMNLLSLDGGGIRGLASLYILAELMQKIKFSSPSPSIQSTTTTTTTTPASNQTKDPLPADYFDMIAGTSTGGIIAIMLGRLRMSVEECITAYKKLGKEVFGKDNETSFITGDGRTKFSEVALERAIADTIESKLGRGVRDAKFMDPKGAHCCKTFVVTYERRAMETPVLFRSYESGTRAVDCTIIQACRATSAAETYFPHITIGDQVYTDGGLGRNNPVDELVREAKSYYRQKGYKVRKPTCIVSIGTGLMSLINLKEAEQKTWWKRMAVTERIGLNVAPILADIVSNCEEAHRRMLETCHNNDETYLYFRFNVDRGLEKIPLDEYEAAGDIESATANYLRELSFDRKPEDCVKMLRFSRMPHATRLLTIQRKAASLRQQARDLDEQLDRMESGQWTGESRSSRANVPVIFAGSTNAGRDIHQTGSISGVGGNLRIGGG